MADDGVRKLNKIAILIGSILNFVGWIMAFFIVALLTFFLRGSLFSLPFDGPRKFVEPGEIFIFFSLLVFCGLGAYIAGFIAKQREILHALLTSVPTVVILAILLMGGGGFDVSGGLDVSDVISITGVPLGILFGGYFAKLINRKYRLQS